MSRVLGIHHITAIAGDPQRNLDFYTGPLGLRLVKRTVNFDDPGTRHFYFGDSQGTPGTILTFFPWGDGAFRGRIGTGQVRSTAFSISTDSLGFWIDRLTALGLAPSGPERRFDEEVLFVRDPDGLELELIANSRDTRAGWATPGVPSSHAIRGLHTASLSVEGYERTAGLLVERLGFRRVGELGNRFRFEVGEGGPGHIVDVLCEPDGMRGTMGAGTVHHIAWRAADDAAQLEIRSTLSGAGQDVTPVLDRNYFRSIYFREPGRVLFEVATDPPGFTKDEATANLGMDLKLPDWLEARRADIEARLTHVTVPPHNNPER